MSHTAALTESKINCDLTGRCSDYYTQLQQADSHIDSHTSSANQTAMTSGIIIGVIGLVVLLTPFVKQLHRLQRIALPKMIVAAPIIIGITAGALISFVLSILICFEFECTSNESTAILAIPLLSLFITIPMARDIYRKRQKVIAHINKLKPGTWIVVGCLIILIAITRTVSSIRENNSNKAYEKSDLQNMMHKP